MKSLIAFFKKEILDSARSGKLVVLGGLFVLFGIMNPALAKLMPWLFEVMSDTLEESGMIVTEVQVDALTSWTQFFKNMPIALIVFVLVTSNTFTKEYQSGTLVLVLTKGVARYKVVLAKSVMMLALWTVGYFICSGVTYGYNEFFWDNSIVVELAPAVINWWLFGVLTICLVVLFSTLSSSQIGVLLGTGGVILASYLVGMLPKIGTFMPTSLMNSAMLLVGTETSDAYGKAIGVAVAACAVCLGMSVPIMNKKQL